MGENLSGLEIKLKKQVPRPENESFRYTDVCNFPPSLQMRTSKKGSNCPFDAVSSGGGLRKAGYPNASQSKMLGGKTIVSPPRF